MSDTQIPTVAKMRADAEAAASAETGLTNPRSVGAIKGSIEALLLLVGRVWDRWVTPASKQVDRSEATGFWLRLHAANAGLTALQPSATRAVFTATAGAAGTLAAGTEVTAAGLPRYAVDAEVTFVAGTFSVPVTAVVAGVAGTLADGTALTPPDGLDSIVAAEGWITLPGEDAEGDDHLRERIDDRMESLGDGHPEAQYRLVAMGVTGIREALVLRTPRGPGSVSVVLRSVAGVPTQAQIDAVEAALDEHRMVTRDLLVQAPPATPAAVALSYRGTATPDAVRAMVVQYVGSLRLGQALTEDGLYSAGRTFAGAELISVDLAGGDRVTPAAGGVVDATVTAQQVN
ncbi:MAG: baseplate J/gp47 family protein [Spirochaetaceae bacterium]|nr:baseplate J/gp47 family protein [Spirochaetaceae bacterium]